MKIIKINSKVHGLKEVFVDDSDYPELIKFNWHIHKSKNKFYTLRELPRKNGKRTGNILMHRQLLQLKTKEMCDHVDRNGLNNQRSNLRKADYFENARNRSAKEKSTSKYVGVFKTTIKCKNGRELNYWVAQIKINKKVKTLGCFPYTKEGEILAAKARDKSALENYKEFANLNFKTK